MAGFKGKNGPHVSCRIKWRDERDLRVHNFDPQNIERKGAPAWWRLVLFHSGQRQTILLVKGRAAAGKTVNMGLFKQTGV